jgi:hypothetical protein
MNGKFERMLKKAVVAYFKVLCQHFPRGTEESHENAIGIAGLRVEF